MVDRAEDVCLQVLRDWASGISASHKGAAIDPAAESAETMRKDPGIARFPVIGG